jgi:hypothetical protein
MHPVNICKDTDCNEKHEAKGYCKRHYAVFLRRSKSKTRTKGCNFSTCTRDNHIYQYCLEHYEEYLKLIKQGTRRCMGCEKIKPRDEFITVKRNKTGISARCKKCSSENNYIRYPVSPEESKKYRLKKFYNMSLDDYNQLLKIQGEVCAVCLQPETSLNHNKTVRSLAVHHNHETGKVIALCCVRCNRGMGYLGDDPELLRRAADLNEQS